MIVGADILMGQNAILPYPPYNEALNVLKLQNGVYDDLLLSRDADKDYGKYNLDNGWQAQTAIYAAFNGDTLGGNLALPGGTDQRDAVKTTPGWNLQLDHPGDQAPANPGE